MRNKIFIGAALMSCLFFASSSINRIWDSGTIQDPALDEISGLVASSRTKDLYWGMNDSANSATLFAITKYGKTISKIAVAGGPYRDIEALGYGNCEFGPKCIYIADIGDNGRERRRIRILIIKEPESDSIAAQISKTIFINYPEGPRNAEAMIVRPGDSAIFIIEKLGRNSRNKNPRVFFIPNPKSDLAEVHTIAEPVAEIENRANHGINLGPITDASFLNNGKGFFVRDYSKVFFASGPIKRGGTLKLRALISPFMRQSEAIAVSSDDRELVITSEGRHSKINTINIGAQFNGK